MYPRDSRWFSTLIYLLEYRVHIHVPEAEFIWTVDPEYILVLITYLITYFVHISKKKYGWLLSKTLSSGWPSIWLFNTSTPSYRRETTAFDQRSARPTPKISRCLKAFTSWKILPQSKACIQSLGETCRGWTVEIKWVRGLKKIC